MFKRKPIVNYYTHTHPPPQLDLGSLNFIMFLLADSGGTSLLSPEKNEAGKVSPTSKSHPTQKTPSASEA